MRVALLANPDNLHVQRWADFLRRRGHTLLVIADPGQSARLPGAETARPEWTLATNILAFRLTPRPHGNSLWKYLHYRPILERFRPDVVHGFEAYNNGLATAWSGAYPKVLTPWGKDVHFDAFQGRLWGWIIRRALRGADCITTNDETMPDYLEQVFAIPREKVRAFSWGVDLRVFHPGQGGAAKGWRRQLEILDGAPVILSPRKFHPYWGSEVVIEAIPGALRARPEAIFVILASDGRAGFRSAMRKRAEALGVAGSIRWIEEWLRPDQMAELFNLAQAFISVPRTDLLAMTVLEGMACGCLPILADRPAYAKHAGLATPAGLNAIVLRAIDPETLAGAVGEALGNADLRRAAAEFNADRMRRLEDASVNMAQIEEVYEWAIRMHAAKGEKSA